MSNEISSVSQNVLLQHNTSAKTPEAALSDEKGVKGVAMKPGDDHVTLSTTARLLTHSASASDSSPAAPVDRGTQRPTPAMANLMQAFLTTSGMDQFDISSDLNADGIINFQDLAALRDIQAGTASQLPEKPEALVERLAESFLSADGDTDFDLSSDHNSDGVINFQDLALLRSLVDKN